MKRVLIVIRSLYNGGAEKSLINLLNELPSEKYEIDLLLFKKEGLFLSQVPEWVNIIDASDALGRLYAPLKQSGKYGIIKIWGTLLSKIMRRGRQKREAFRWKHVYSHVIPRMEKNYDVAIAYTSSEPMFFVGDKVTATKKITWVHNDFRSANHDKEFSEKYFDQMEIVSISRKCVDILKEEFPQYREKIFLIENITSSKVTRERAKDFYPNEFKDNELNIISIGRLSEQKGFDIAIKAASILRNKGVSFKWFVIGDGDLYDQLTSQIVTEDLKEYFVLLGTRSNPYPYIYYSDVFVQSSRYEGKSVVLDEAKILCAPIVVTNYPTVRDQIDDGNEGMIVEMSPEGIADGIITAIDSEVKNKFVNYLYEHEYGNQKEVNKYIELIDR